MTAPQSPPPYSPCWPAPALLTCRSRWPKTTPPSSSASWSRQLPRQLLGSGVTLWVRLWLTTNAPWAIQSKQLHTMIAQLVNCTQGELPLPAYSHPRSKLCTRLIGLDSLGLTHRVVLLHASRMHTPSCSSQQKRWVLITCWAPSSVKQRLCIAPWYADCQVNITHVANFLPSSSYVLHV